MSLQFNEATHQYAWDGQLVPSVTRILAPLNQFDGIPPDVLAAAADRGNRVHKATELIDEGTLDRDSVADIAGYLDGYEQWLRDMSPVILESERSVYSGSHRYAGTLDRVVGVGGEEWLIDIKSSANVAPTVGPQTAAYERALGWGKPLKRAVLHLRPDGTYRWRELSSAQDWPVFVACMLIHRFKEGRSNV